MRIGKGLFTYNKLTNWVKQVSEKATPEWKLPLIIVQHITSVLVSFLSVCLLNQLAETRESLEIDNPSKSVMDHLYFSVVFVARRNSCHQSEKCSWCCIRGHANSWLPKSAAFMSYDVWNWGPEDRRIINESLVVSCMKNVWELIRNQVSQRSWTYQRLRVIKRSVLTARFKSLQVDTHNVLKWKDTSGCLEGNEYKNVWSEKWPEGYIHKWCNRLFLEDFIYMYSGYECICLVRKWTNLELNYLGYKVVRNTLFACKCSN